MRCIRVSCGKPRYLAGIYCRDCREYIVLDTNCPYPAGNPHHAWYLAERRRRMKLKFTIDDRFVIGEEP